MIYNPNELRHPPPPNFEDSARDSETEQYIRCTKLFHSNSIDSLLIVLSVKRNTNTRNSLTSLHSWRPNLARQGQQPDCSPLIHRRLLQVDRLLPKLLLQQFPMSHNVPCQDREELLNLLSAIRNLLTTSSQAQFINRRLLEAFGTT